jgi:hypothetical protein
MNSTSRSEDKEIVVEAQAEIIIDDPQKHDVKHELVKPDTGNTDVANTPEESGEGRVKLRGEKLEKKKLELLNKHNVLKGGSIIDSLKHGKISAEDAIDIIIHELARETDSLKGNELLFENEGNIRDASTIAIKRFEALEKIAKTIHRKQQMTSSEIINLDSPYIRLLITWIMTEVRNVFIDIKMEQPVVDLFFEKFSKATENWKTQVKREMMMLKERQESEVPDSTNDKDDDHKEENSND